MSTTTPVMARKRPLPLGTIRVRARGLLASVTRSCPDHGGDCVCVARRPADGCLVYWCADGVHHYTR